MRKKILLIGVLTILGAFGVAVTAEDGDGSRKKSPAAASFASQAREWGLAAKYPGDEGIELDSAVVFSDNFESGSVADFSQRWTSILNPKSDVLKLLNDTTAVTTGKRCLEMRATKGQNTGGHLWKLLDHGYDKLYARFYCKFAPDAPYVHHFVAMGGRVNSPPYPMGGAGTRPSGADRFGTTIDLVGRDVANPPGAWSFYSYWCEMHSWQTPEGVSDGRPNPYYGNLFGPVEPLQAKRGEWQCVEFMIKLNDPDQRNGEQAFWIDGKLVERYGPGTIKGTWFRDKFRRSGVYNTDPQPFEGFRWRTSEQLKINIFWLQYYLAHIFENDYNPHDPDIPYNDNIATVYFDNIVLATEYIGPIAVEPTGCDFNGDGNSDISDVIGLIRSCMIDSGNPLNDYNRDGRGNVIDVLMMLRDIVLGRC